MALETATYIDALVVSNPDGSDQRATADDHLRLIKAVLKRSFPMVGGAVSASAAALSRVNDLSLSAQAQLNTLRDGPETANYAVVARTAVSASSAAALGGLPAAEFPQLAAHNVWTSSWDLRKAPWAASYVQAEASTAGEQCWIVNYANYGRLYWGTTGDSQTYGTTFLMIDRSGTSPRGWSMYGTSIEFYDLDDAVTYDLTNPSRMGGAAASAYARLDTARTFNGGSGSTPVTTTVGAGTLAINCEDGDVHRITLTGSITLGTPTAPRPGQTLVIILQQDAVGSRTVAWSTVFRFAGGSTPTLSTGGWSKDVFAFIYDNTDGHWLQSGLNVTR